MGVSARARYDYMLHKEIIAGGFVIGTLAFLVAHAWNAFFLKLLAYETASSSIWGKVWQVHETRDIEESSSKNSSWKTTHGGVIYYGIYAVFITAVSIGVVFLLIHFDFIRHGKSLPSGTKG